MNKLEKQINSLGFKTDLENCENKSEFFDKQMHEFVVNYQNIKDSTQENIDLTTNMKTDMFELLMKYVESDVNIVGGVFIEMLWLFTIVRGMSGSL